MNNVVIAGLWGLLSGSALIIGAIVGYYCKIPQRIIGGIMAFGSGVLISALSFDLMDEAFKTGGIFPAAIGFLGGSLIYSIANYFVNQQGAKHRKRSGNQQGNQEVELGKNNSTSIAVGALLDGIPESIVIGVSMLAGGNVSMVAVIAIFLSNIPEGLSSAAGMRKAGKSPQYVFSIWMIIAIISGLSSLSGYLIFGHFDASVIAATTAIAAGAILSMIANTMMPEAFESDHDSTGFITVLGFLAAFCLTKMAL